MGVPKIPTKIFIFEEILFNFPLNIQYTMKHFLKKRGRSSCASREYPHFEQNLLGSSIFDVISCEERKFSVQDPISFIQEYYNNGLSSTQKQFFDTIHHSWILIN